MQPISPHLSVEVLRDGRTSGGAYALLEVRAPAGLAIPPNVNRRCAAALHVLEGAVALVVGGEPVRLEPGDHVDVPRDVPWRAEVEADARLLLVGTPSGIECLASMLGQPPLEDDDAAALLAAAGISRVHASW